MGRDRTAYMREYQRRRRRSAILFAWLVGATCHSRNPFRGFVDAATGAVTFAHRGWPRRTTVKDRPHTEAPVGGTDTPRRRWDDAMPPAERSSGRRRAGDVKTRTPAEWMAERKARIARLSVAAAALGPKKHTAPHEPPTRTKPPSARTYGASGKTRSHSIGAHHMSIDVTKEKLIRFSEVPDLPWMPKGRHGGKISRLTVYGWEQDGLEVMDVGGVRCTSEDALRRYFERKTRERRPDAETTPAQRSAAHERAVDQLRAIGVTASNRLGAS